MSRSIVRKDQYIVAQVLVVERAACRETSVWNAAVLEIRAAEDVANDSPLFHARCTFKKLINKTVSSMQLVNLSKTRNLLG